MERRDKDKAEVLKAEIGSSPKYAITQRVNQFNYGLFDFNGWLPLAAQGEFTFNTAYSNLWIYVIPLSPRLGIVKYPKNAGYEQTIGMFLRSFDSDAKIARQCLEFAFTDLDFLFDYSIIP